MFLKKKNRRQVKLIDPEQMKHAAYMKSQRYYAQLKTMPQDTPRDIQRYTHTQSQGAYWMGRAYQAGHPKTYFTFSMAIRLQDQNEHRKEQAKILETMGVPANDEGYKTLMKMGLQVGQRDICWALHNSIAQKENPSDKYCRLRTQTLEELDTPLNDKSANMLSLLATLDKHAYASFDTVVRMTMNHRENQDLFSTLDEYNLNEDALLKFAASNALSHNRSIKRDTRDFIANFKNILETPALEKHERDIAKNNIIQHYFL